MYFRRRRKQRKLLETLGKTGLSSRYLDASGASSRAQLVTPIPPPSYLPSNTGTHSSHHRLNASYHPSLNSSFAQNFNRYHRESQSELDLHHNSINGIDYRSIPNRFRPTPLNENYRGYGTMDYSSNNFDGNHLRRSLPKSFSDCDLCKRRIINEEQQQYSKEQDDNWRLENTQPRTYRDQIKERVISRPISDNELIPSSTVEYSTVLPRHQRITNENVHHLPFEYTQNENSNQERATGISNENNYTGKYYQHDDDDETKNRLNRRLHDPREIQRMSMRMNDRHSYYHQ